MTEEYLDRYGKPIEGNRFYFISDESGELFIYVEGDRERGFGFKMSALQNISFPFPQELAGMSRQRSPKIRIMSLEQEADWIKKILAEQEVEAGRS